MIREIICASVVLVAVVVQNEAPSRTALGTGMGHSVRVETFSVSGVVRDEATGRVMSGVVIAADTLRARRTMSDTAGRYELRDLPLGDYVIVATRIGYYVERRELSVHCAVRVTDASGRQQAMPACRPTAQSLSFNMRIHAHR